jgi:hypothetical protein
MFTEQSTSTVRFSFRFRPLGRYSAATRPGCGNCYFSFPFRMRILSLRLLSLEGAYITTCK